MSIEQLETTDFRHIPKPEVRSPKPEVRSPKPEVRSPKPAKEQFSQYLMAIKGAKLTETQLRKLGETQAGDERTRTVEKINERKADSDDAQYRKMRASGYTVGETRRGVDQVDKALERQTLETQSAERRAQRAESREQRAESRAQSADAARENLQATTQQNAFQQNASGQNAGELPNVPGTMPNDAAVNAVNQNVLDVNGALSQALDTANTSAQQARNVATNSTGNGSQVNQAANTLRNAVEQAAIRASEQQTNHPTTSAGKAAVSLVATMAGMTPVSRSESARLSGELDAKMTHATGLTNTPKESAKDNLTQEALTAASETQQVANDPGQSQPDSGAMQASRDVAESQMLPNTSLMERLDQARLVNRVAGAFRSLANQSGTIRMKLHPEELGALTLRMQIESGKVTAKLEAETETAKQVLLANIETLKKRLKEQNLEVSAFEIEVVASETGKTTRKQQPGQTVARNNKDQNEHIDIYF